MVRLRCMLTQAGATRREDSMKALVHDGNGHISLEDRPEPQLQSPTDAIVRVTRSTICTSDLHIIHGAVPRATPNTVLGHEFVGVVVESIISAISMFIT